MYRYNRIIWGINFLFWEKAKSGKTSEATAQGVEEWGITSDHNDSRNECRNSIYSASVQRNCCCIIYLDISYPFLGF